MSNAACVSWTGGVHPGADTPHALMRSSIKGRGVQHLGQTGKSKHSLRPIVAAHVCRCGSRR